VPADGPCGVRAPAVIISRSVSRGAGDRERLDTSSLKVLGARFKGGSSSPEVDERPVGSVADILRAPPADAPPPVIPTRLADLDRLRGEADRRDASPFGQRLAAFPEEEV
jgi:hypothetical protein